jgi:uncharacterized protein (TIRG00374 family)
VSPLLQRRHLARWSWLPILLLAGILLLLALRGTDWNEIVRTFQRGQLGYLALASLVLSVSHFSRGLRWRVLLSAEKVIAPATLFWATVVGYLANNFLPARSGDVIRSVMISRVTPLSGSYAFATVVTERIMDVVALVLVSSVALMLLNHVPVPEWLITATRVMALLSVVSVLALFIAPRFEGLLKNLVAWLPLPGSLAARLMGFITGFLLGMRPLRNPGRAARFAALTVLIWLLDAVLAIAVAWAFDLTLRLPEAFLLLAALGLSSAVPSTPGYVGIYQFVAVTVLSLFEFLRHEALVYIIAFQAVSYLVVIVWGTVGLWRLTGHLAGPSMFSGGSSHGRAERR